MVLRIAVAALFAGLSAAAAQASVTLASSPNPSAFGQSVTLTATVPTSASGKVTFYDSAVVLGIAPVVNGQAVLKTILLPFGRRSLTANYAGATSAVLTQLVGAPPVGANGFRNAGSYNVVGGYPSQIAVGDFNGDGIADLAVPGSASDTVDILLGQGNGSFLPPVSYPIGGGASAVAAGDFNGDGKGDLAVARDTSAVSILLGNGDGTFQPSRNFTVISTPQYLAIGDFNGDGNLDIVAAGTGGLSVLLGNGDGTFQPAGSYLLGGALGGVAVADFNDDGIADLAVPVISVPGSSIVAVMLGIGNGFFQFTATYTVGGAPVAIVAGDFNGDGKADIAVTQFSSDNVDVLLGNGDGTLQPPMSYVVGIGPQMLAVLDFNADGKPDLVTASSTAGVVSVLLGSGDGTFQPPLNFAVPAAALDSVAVGDFNGDGRIDLALDGSTLTVLLGESLPPTITMFEVPASTAYYNQPLTLTATVSPPSATGIVSFFAGPASLGTASLSSGQAVITASLVNIGPNFLRALYNGDAGDAESASPSVAVTVGLAPTTTLLSASPNPVTANAKLTLTATVTPAAATGTMAFYQGTTLFGTAKVANGQVGMLTGLGAVGTFWLSASFSGDSDYLPSTSNTVMEVVTGALTAGLVSLSSSVNPSALGQPVTLTAAVSPATATGSVMFYDGTTILGDAPIANGKATLTTSLLASGARSLHAFYAGDVNNGAGTSATILQTVNAGPTNTLHLAQSYAGVQSPLSMLVADFNGDGKADIAVVGESSTVNVFLGRGDGTFQAAPNAAAGEAVNAIAVGDFNGDGKPDLVVVGTGIFTLLGKGDGTFQQPIFAGSTSYGIPVVGDFNRDGKADLALIYGASVIVLLGNGDGTFQAPATYETYELFSSANAISLGDFNGDGNADIAVASRSGVILLLGNGDGTFQPPKLVVAVSCNAIAVGDFNNDGKLDILYQGSSGLSVILGNGNGTFENPVTSASLITNGPLAVGDFNGDGKLDVAGVDYLGFSVQLGNGDGTFQAGVNDSIFGSALLVSGEFNGDGKADFAVAGNNTLNIFLGAVSAATTTALTASPNPANFGQAVTLTATVSPPSASGTVAFYDGVTLLGTGVLNNGRASLTTLSLLSGADSLKAVYSGDASNLGSTSAVVSQLVGAAPTPANGFRSPMNSGAGLDPLSVAAGDFNGDGKPDLAVANFGSVVGNSSVSVLLGNGDGTFQPAVDYRAGNGVGAVAVGDINGDGKADLVVANYSDGTVSMLLGNGDGTFQPAITFAAGKNPISIAIGDFNGDGIPDLAVADYNASAGSVSVLLGKGDGTFQPAVSYPIGAGGFCVMAGDLYENGILDLAVGTSTGVAILTGNANGTFNAPVNYPTGNSPVGVVIGDFNRDGRADLAIVNNLDNTVMVLLGNPGQ